MPALLQRPDRPELPRRSLLQALTKPDEGRRQEPGAEAGQSRVSWLLLLDYQSVPDIFRDAWPHEL